MENLTVSPIQKFSKTLPLPGDKSISHRAAMLGAIAKGKTEIRNFLVAEDCLHTVKAFQKMGVETSFQGKDQLTIKGRGLHGLKRPGGPIYLGNSGTSMRLLLGILAGQPFSATVTGDPSLSQRPMRRVVFPLEKMGAAIEGKGGEHFAPLTIRGGVLKGIRYHLPVPSAQVKSAILLAGLYAEGITSVIESSKTRDHTERMLQHFGKKLAVRGLTVSLKGNGELEGSRVAVPGDISSAAFFIVLASALEGSKLIVHNVGVNPTRIGFIRVLKRMGADITLIPKKESREKGEPEGDIEVRGRNLKGTTVLASEIPGLIDELPILMVAGACAKGKTQFQQASELRVKETDRIYSMVTNLRKMGVSIWNESDDVIIDGGKPFHGSTLQSYKDHRTAMSLAVAGRLAQKGKTLIRDVACIRTSFPDFINLI
ncbi:MAG: 3-phosphoshikimate 1-carboxyvinyltransferase [Candidatus Omnitrophica bacterium]|nr:3-phosphoshikimate 1-carboxyvinyltransferase [Candidatus Omnitrophota bacterium]